MATPMSDHLYDKIKILYKLSSVLWFIEHHAMDDAHKDERFKALLAKLEQDLERHVAALKEITCKD